MIDNKTMEKLCSQLEPIFNELAKYFLPGESVEVHFLQGSAEFKFTDNTFEQGGELPN